MYSEWTIFDNRRKMGILQGCSLKNIYIFFCVGYYLLALGEFISWNIIINDFLYWLKQIRKFTFIPINLRPFQYILNWYNISENAWLLVPKLLLKIGYIILKSVGIESEICDCNIHSLEEIFKLLNLHNRSFIIYGICGKYSYEDSFSQNRFVQSSEEWLYLSFC